MPHPIIRPIRPADLPRILAIQAACYPAELLEDELTFLAKLDFAPQSSWLIEDQEHVLGYLFAHPWQGDAPPALNRGQAAWPTAADRFYLHDLAIHPDGRGLQLSTALTQHALSWAQAQGFKLAMLVAVGQAAAFWEKHGFCAANQSAPALSQYGEAVLMRRKLL